MRGLNLLVGAVLLVAGCAGESEHSLADGGVDAGPTIDAGADAGSLDAGPADAGPPSLLLNGSFDAVDSQGHPLDWSCGCEDASGNLTPGSCATQPGSLAGIRALKLEPNCYAIQKITAFSPDGGARFTAQLSGLTSGSNIDLYALAPGEEEPAGDTFSTALGPVTSGEVHSVGSLSLEGTNQLDFVVGNWSGTGALLFEAPVVSQESTEALPQVGALLLATHDEIHELTAGAEAAAYYTPLPLDWATQVPLDLELTVTPRSVVDQITYQRDAVGNLGATISFVQGSSALAVDLNWKAVLLVRDLSDAERASVYAATNDPTLWLPSPTTAVEASLPGIESTAAAFTGATAEDQLTQLLAWTSTNIAYGIAAQQTGLDAASTYDAREGTCTGFGNLASALGRDLGNPTRTLANILVGEPQQVHSINEYYLGASGGWRRIEPQGTATSVPEEYSVGLRLVTPDDEGPGAMSTDRWAFPGVPLHTLTEPVSGYALLPLKQTKFFPTCAECFNDAEWQAMLQDSDGTQLASLFTQARSLWERDLSTLLSGASLSADVLAARHAFLSAHSLDDVAAELQAIP